MVYNFTLTIHILCKCSDTEFIFRIMPATDEPTVVVEAPPAEPEAKKAKVELTIEPRYKRFAFFNFFFNHM